MYKMEKEGLRVSLVISSIVCFLLIVLSSVSAQTQQTLGGIDGYDPSEDIGLIQVCANCTSINVTYIVLGNGTLLPVNEAMTKDRTVFNYTFFKNHTSSIGEYIVNWEGDPDGVADSGNYNFFVRRGGVSLTTGEAILNVMLIVVTFLAMLLFFHFAIIFPYSDERSKDGSFSRLIPPKYLKILSFWFAYGAFLWFMNILTGIVNTFISLEFARSLVSNSYIFFYYLGFVITTVVLILMFLEVWKDLFVPVIKIILRKHGNRKRKK